MMVTKSRNGRKGSKKHAGLAPCRLIRCTQAHKERTMREREVRIGESGSLAVLASAGLTGST
jgi:hypothetical protein